MCMKYFELPVSQSLRVFFSETNLPITEINLSSREINRETSPTSVCT